MECEAVMTNMNGKKIGTLRSDNGEEHMPGEFQTCLKKNGFRHENTVSHTLEQNGVVESMSRNLQQKARAMLTHAGLRKRYRAEAVATASCLRNRPPTWSTQCNLIPCELWDDKMADLTSLKVFGCIADLHVHTFLMRTGRNLTRME